MIRRALARGWNDPRVRRAVARAVVLVGLVIGLIGMTFARWGWLVAGVVIVGVGASLGPGRIRSTGERRDH